MANTVAISGANRGIGLAFVDAYLQAGYTVFAGCRVPSVADDLQARQAAHPEQLHIAQLDVTDDASIAQFAATVTKTAPHLDQLVNNAALFTTTPLEAITRAESLRLFEVNSIGPVLMFRALLPLLRAAPRPVVVNISSNRGSVSGQRDTKLWDYAASKAALNSYMRKMAFELAPRGLSVAIDPGWVQTNMGGDNADLTPAQSVAGMMDVISTLEADHNGGFFLWNGERQLW